MWGASSQKVQHSVLMFNPRLPVKQREMTQKVAKYESELPFGESFAEVASHILKARSCGM